MKTDATKQNSTAVQNRPIAICLNGTSSGCQLIGEIGLNCLWALNVRRWLSPITPSHRFISYVDMESKKINIISNMVKKRKAGGRPSGNHEARSMNSGESRLRINTYEDVADSEDEFHINRDKILLEEGPAQKRQRRALEEGRCISKAATGPINTNAVQMNSSSLQTKRS